MRELNIFDEISKNSPSFLKSVLFSISYIILGHILNLIVRHLINKVSEKIYERGDKGSKDLTARVDTVKLILRKSCSIVITIVVILMILSEMGVAVGPLLAGIGVLGVALGFGAQYLVKDLISGFFIILEDRMRVGDVVKIDSFEGSVENINLRTTILRNVGGQIYIIPNGEIKVIENFSRDFIRLLVEVDLPYSLDLNSAYILLSKIKENLLEDDEFKKNLLEDIEIQGIVDFGKSALKYRIVAKLKSEIGRLKAGMKIRNSIFTILKANNIEIPFEQLDVKIKNKT